MNNEQVRASALEEATTQRLAELHFYQEDAPTMDVRLHRFALAVVAHDRQRRAAPSSGESEAEQWSKGRDDDNGSETGDALPCAGITIDDHGNAIEFYADSLELAQSRRDRVLVALAAPAAPAQGVLPEVRKLSDDQAVQIGAKLRLRPKTVREIHEEIERHLSAAPTGALK